MKVDPVSRCCSIVNTTGLGACTPNVRYALSAVGLLIKEIERGVEREEAKTAIRTFW